MRVDKIEDMIRELVFLQENVDYLQEYSIIITNKSKHDDITNVILDGGDN